MTAGLILVMLAFFGIAIDLSRMYNRKVELRTAADSIALAAATKLDGTATGISNALAAAAEAAGTSLYAYNGASVEWSDSAISFGSSADGSDWVDSGAAPGRPESLYFVKVDTSKLDPKHGEVETLFINVVAPGTVSAQVVGTSVAGRSTTNVTPFALCAMSTQPAESRGGELVQYGFRRGVSYNLMQLNPDTALYGTNGLNYLVNPIAPPGTTGTSMAGKMDVVQPFVCTGTLAMPRVTGGPITVEAGFPLASLYAQFNSRFGSYAGPCKSDTAPPDVNVKEFQYATELKWMATTPNGQTPEPTTSDNKLHTVLDLQPADVPGGLGAESYGPLWVYAKAARYLASEPATGDYPSYSANNTDWAALYPPAKPKLSTSFTYPTATPYGAATGATFQAPPSGLKGLKDRRVLNVPLLQCPVSGSSPGSANVVAIAKFFMTVPATNDKLYAEFVGLAKESTLGGQVEVYR
jgi:Flp pilus assembly protein TadG